MKLDDFLIDLANSLKVPETLEEAKAYIKKDTACQVTIDDLAFKQVVINILIAAGIVSEQDFNDSVEHFKNIITEDFAKKLLSNMSKIKNRMAESENNTLFETVNLDQDSDEDVDWEDELPPGKKYYDA